MATLPPQHKMEQGKDSTLIDLACTVCLEIFTDPKVLPCCHTFCLKCLKGILEKAASRENILCPQCRLEHKVPQSGCEGFLSDYSLLCSNGSDVSSKDQPICEQCDDGKQCVSFCNDCIAYLCEFCQGAHKRLKVYRSHSVTRIDQVSPEKIASLKRSELKCDIHPKELLDIYCKSCFVLVCSQCLIAYHLDHDLAGVDSETRETVQKDIVDLIEASKTTLGKLSGCTEYIQDVEDVTLERTEKVKQKVKKEYQSVIASLQKECEERLNEIDKHSNKQLKFIWSEKDYTERLTTSLHTSIKFAQRSLQCSDIELLRLSSQAISMLRTLSSMDWNENDVVEIANTRVSYKRIYAVPKLGVVNMETVDNEVVVANIDSVPTKYSIGKPLCIQVKLLNLKGQPPLKFRIPNVSVSVKYRKELNLSPDRISIVNVSRNVSEITVKPVCGGAHVMTLSIPEADPPMVTKEYEVAITGRPPTGARVTRGPDWIHRNKDGGIGNLGTIRNSCYSMCGYDNALLVDWDNGSSNHICRWQNQGFYDVQLV